MGGPCDRKISAETPEEMMDEAMNHMRTDHPNDKKMTSMSEDEREDWKDGIMKKWDALPES